VFRGRRGQSQSGPPPLSPSSILPHFSSLLLLFLFPFLPQFTVRLHCKPFLFVCLSVCLLEFSHQEHTCYLNLDDCLLILALATDYCVHVLDNSCRDVDGVFVFCVYAGSSMEFETEADKGFTTKQYLSVHKQTHTGKDMYSCSECEESVLSQDGLRRHRYIHTSKYQCTECGKCFRDTYDLARHTQSHSSEKSFECDVCSRQFKTSAYLNIHLRIHSGEKPYTCHMCDKAFNFSSHLKRHMRIHTGDKPYKCSLCIKSFSDSGNLQTHRRRVHSNSRPYQCPYCWKAFKTNIDLKCHLPVHSDAKLYSCGYRSERYSRPDQHLLKSHAEGT